ncbi:MAG: M23 family metallopeptidase [Bacteroidales bacterium]|jgi:murein DD-endopeptidase MepM/ murein hydrolase activator NlpD|nr:M23 family metallopeptidase [Bacteroidales bacterium]
MGRQNPIVGKHTYRLSLVDNETHESIRSIRFGKAQGIYWLITAVLALLLLFYLLFAYTPLRTIIPGYPNAHSKKEAVANAIKIDSLENVVTRWNVYAEHLSRVLTGQSSVDFDSLVRAGTARYLSDKDAAELVRQDSVLRETVQKEEQFGVSALGERELPIEGMHFFTPIKGVVAAGFDRAVHPYIEISAPTGTVVSAVLDGTVVFTAWDAEQGYIIILQHHDDLLSVYTNNQKLLRDSGDEVKAGTPIALVGGTSRSEGNEHLHFELWHRGESLDPTRYISF